MLARERAEDELRHRHVRGGFDPVSGHVAEYRGEAAVVELDEVVDIAADLDARRRLVRVAELEPAELREGPRQQRALHRVGELLLLLVEARVVDRERSLSADRLRLLDRLLRHTHVRAEGHNGQRREHLGRRGDRDNSAGPAALEERHEPARRCAHLLHLAPREHERLAESEEPLHRLRAEGLGMPEDRADRGLHARVDDVNRVGDKRFAALIRHANQRDVDIEDVRDRRRQRLKRRVEGEALRERA